MATETFKSLQKIVEEHLKTIQNQQQTIIGLKTQIDKSHRKPKSQDSTISTLTTQEANIHRLDSANMGLKHRLDSANREIATLKQRLEPITQLSLLNNRYITIIESLTQSLKSLKIPNNIPKSQLPISAHTPKK